MFSIGKETSFCWVTEHLDPPNQRTQEFAGSLPSSSSLTDSLCHYQRAASSRKYLFGISCFFREIPIWWLLSSLPHAEPKASLPLTSNSIDPSSALRVICMSAPSSSSSSSSFSFSFGVERVRGLFIKVTHVHGSNLEYNTPAVTYSHCTTHYY